jgi:mRNA-degrading endonuclease RelE of RelBE toxin-antitoxin system
MGKKIAWTDQAKADLRAIDQPTALPILHIVANYLATGEGDVKRLQDGVAPEFRLRVGDYRLYPLRGSFSEGVSPCCGRSRSEAGLCRM